MVLLHLQASFEFVGNAKMRARILDTVLDPTARQGIRLTLVEECRKCDAALDLAHKLGTRAPGTTGTEQETKKNQRMRDKEKGVRIPGVEPGAAAIREFPVPELADTVIKEFPVPGGQPLRHIQPELVWVSRFDLVLQKILGCRSERRRDNIHSRQNGSASGRAMRHGTFLLDYHCRICPTAAFTTTSSVLGLR